MPAGRSPHYLVRVMWALLRRGTEWQENPALANKPSSGSHGCPEANGGGASDGEAAEESLVESA